MTAKECAYKYGTGITVTSVGDTIETVSYRLYKSVDAKYMNALIALNQRYDWQNIAPATSISFLPKQAVDSFL